jgi:ribosomal protein L30E
MVLTKHASDRAIKYNLDSQTIKKIIDDGQRILEGKTKTRYVLQTKHGKLVAICSECPDQITIITITKGK